MLTQSAQIDQLASALADAQADLGTVLKQSQNDAFGSKYADLTKVWEAFQRVGPRHGLSVVQMPGHFDASSRTMSMSVRLMHNSGQWLGGDMSMPLSRSDAHAYGSACTYARRYSLAALIGICPHDDDGNEASGVQVMTPSYRVDPRWGYRSQNGAPLARPTQGRQSIPQAGREETIPPNYAGSEVDIPADPQGLKELRELAAAAAVEETVLCQHYGVETLEELSPRDAARVRRALTRKVQSAAGEVN